jgi:CubicO group peptidase (beta-lactamase class C family)
MKTKAKLAAWIIMIFPLFGLAALLSPAAEVVKEDLGAKLDLYLTRITPFGFSGAVLVAKGDEIVLNKGYSLAIRAENIPNTADTVFCTGSITKQFTAAAIMTLEMQGKLKTEDPVSKYLDGVPPDKSAITLHNLLTHTSGLVPDVGGDYEQDGRDETVKKILALELEFKPGERFEYSNVNYTLLAAIIEKVSGQAYEDYLCAHLFKPAGMEWTGYRRPRWDERVVAHWYVTTKDNANSLSRPFPYWNLIGNGGILSTTEDMFKWHKALLGNAVLSEAAKKKLYTPFLNDYAYGWDALQTPHGLLIQHNGGSDLGNNAEVRRYIDARVVTILLSNQFYQGRPLIDSVRDQVESLAFGGDVPMPPAVKSLSAADLKKYEGDYKLPSGGTLSVTGENNGLTVRAKGQDAVNALVFSDRDDLKAILEVHEKSARVAEAAAKGDFGPLGEVMANKEKRFDAVRRLIEGRIREAEPRTGKILRAEAFYTKPSAMEEGAVETAVVLHGERGLIPFRMIWRDGLNIGIGPLFLILPVSTIIQPLADNEFCGFDLASPQTVKMNFSFPSDAPANLEILGKNKVRAIK